MSPVPEGEHICGILSAGQQFYDLRLGAQVVESCLVDDFGNGQGVGRARSGLLANLNVTYEVTQQLTVYAYARNIGGSRFEPANGYATPGPSFLAGTRVRF